MKRLFIEGDMGKSGPGSCMGHVGTCNNAVKWLQIILHKKYCILVKTLRDYISLGYSRLDGVFL